MIAIAVGVIVVIAVVIDVSCYFMSGCGVTMCICVRLCDRQPADEDDTAELKETNNRNNDVEATPQQAPAPAHDDRYRRHFPAVAYRRARRAVHAGPALWGAQNLPDAVF